MEYGIFLRGYQRPKSKKEVKDAVLLESAHVSLEDTSFIGDPHPSGPVANLPDGTYTFVGPDPYNKRNFYGNIVKKGGKITVK